MIPSPPWALRVFLLYGELVLLPPYKQQQSAIHALRALKLKFPRQANIWPRFWKRSLEIPPFELSIDFFLRSGALPYCPPTTIAINNAIIPSKNNQTNKQLYFIAFVLCICKYPSYMCKFNSLLWGWWWTVMYSFSSLLYGASSSFQKWFIHVLVRYSLLFPL